VKRRGGRRSSRQRGGEEGRRRADGMRRGGGTPRVVGTRDGNPTNLLYHRFEQDAREGARPRDKTRHLSAIGIYGPVWNLGCSLAGS
jgi:hypothetical protein